LKSELLATENVLSLTNNCAFSDAEGLADGERPGRLAFLDQGV
jgi:hypothetical protein